MTKRVVSSGAMTKKILQQPSKPAGTERAIANL